MSSVDSGDGTLILKRAWCHIAGGNGAIIDPVSQEFKEPRNPWSAQEEKAVTAVLESVCKESVPAKS